MNMAIKRDLVGEIEEIRERQGPNAYPVTIPFRMLRIAQAFKAAPELDRELLRYIPIGKIACVEGFFRSAVKECIDAGGTFLENARQLNQAKDLRADIDMLGALHGRRISIGELVAHLVSINGLAQIDSIMSTITGTRFLESLRMVQSRWDVEVERKPAGAIIADPDLAFRHVEEMFRLRHIYAHEVTFEEPERSAIGEALASSVAFLTAAGEVVANLLHPNAPLTQADMNEQSARDLEAIDAQVDAALGELSALVDADRRVLLHAAHEVWREFRHRQAEFQARLYQGGSIYPVIYGGAAQALAQARLEDLRRCLRREWEEP